MFTLCTNFFRHSAWLVGVLGASQAWAADLPPDMLHAGQPIEALCFESISADEWSDLSRCVLPEIVKLPADSADHWAADKIGYHYRYKEDQSDALSYVYYDYVGQSSGASVVLSYASGGGTGQFTSLFSIERNQDKVRVLQGFAAGDRCNGGVVDARISLGTLYYGQHMTPIDFLQLAEDNPNGLQPYEDLEASATSCFGVARFEDEKFVGVTLIEALEDQPQWTEQYQYQPCFNQQYRALLAKGKKELSAAELKEFTAEFNEVCLPHDPAR